MSKTNGNPIHSTVETWMQYGACVGADPRLFSRRASRDDAANRYCRTCPVLLSCGRYADRYRLDGLWGGKFRLLRKNGRYTVLGCLMSKTARVNDGS
jgi:hypothetical protein